CVRPLPGTCPRSCHRFSRPCLSPIVFFLLFPVPYISIVNPWKVIQLHGPQWQSAGHCALFFVLRSPFGTRQGVKREERTDELKSRYCRWPVSWLSRAFSSLAAAAAPPRRDPFA